MSTKLICRLWNGLGLMSCIVCHLYIRISIIFQLEKVIKTLCLSIARLLIHWHYIARVCCVYKCIRSTLYSTVHTIAHTHTHTLHSLYRVQSQRLKLRGRWQYLAEWLWLPGVSTTHQTSNPFSHIELLFPLSRLFSYVDIMHKTW